MAKYQKKKIQDTDNSNFGNYQEGIGGGGSPEKGDPSKHGHGVNSDYRQANNDTMQPRTDDGKFTYKSVNGQSINPKYGPSRGETVNPLLTGGENGVKIADVKQQFANKSGAIWDKYKDKWYVKGSEYVLMSQGKGHKKEFATRVAGEAIWEVGKRRYDKIKGEFEGESKIFEEGKKGKMGKEEKTAKQLAKTTGQEQAVIDKATNAIKIKPGTVPLKPTEVLQKQPATSQKSSSPVDLFKPEEKMPSQPVEDKKFGTGKYTWQEGSSVRDYLKEQLGSDYDPMFDDDTTLEEFIDANGGKEIFEQIGTSAKSETPVEKMGFKE